MGVIQKEKFQEMREKKTFFYLVDIKKTLVKNKLSTMKKKKKELVDRLDNHYRKLDYYEKNYLDKIILIQRSFKRWKVL